MAKTLKKLIYVQLECDETGQAYGSCKVASEIGSDDDATLSKITLNEYILSGTELTQAQALFDYCKNQVESDESIV